MRYFLLITAGCIFSLQAFALEATTNFFNSLATSGTSVGSSASTHTTKRDKIIAQAQSDAVAYVGSHGQVKGVFLEMALNHIRQQYPQIKQMSDLTLAEAILAY